MIIDNGMKRVLIIGLVVIACGCCHREEDKEYTTLLKEYDGAEMERLELQGKVDSLYDLGKIPAPQHVVDSINANGPYQFQRSGTLLLLDSLVHKLKRQNQLCSSLKDRLMVRKN